MYLTPSLHDYTIEKERERAQIAYQSLHHSWSLDSQVFDGLEHVHESLGNHPLQNDVQRNEHSSASNPVARRTSVYSQHTHTHTHYKQ